MNTEILTEAINYLLILPQTFLLILIVRSFFRSFRALKWKLRKFGWKNLLLIAAELKSPLFGGLVILCAFALTSTLLGAVPLLTENSAVELEFIQNPNTILEGLLYIENTGIIGVSLFILAGFFYIMAGFRDWLKWVARFFMLAAPGYILLQIFHYAVLAA